MWDDHPKKDRTHRIDKKGKCSLQRMWLPTDTALVNLGHTFPDQGPSGIAVGDSDLCRCACSGDCKLPLLAPWTSRSWG